MGCGSVRAFGGITNRKNAGHHYCIPLAAAFGARVITYIRATSAFFSFFTSLCPLSRKDCVRTDGLQCHTPARLGNRCGRCLLGTGYFRNAAQEKISRVCSYGFVPHFRSNCLWKSCGRSTSSKLAVCRTVTRGTVSRSTFRWWQSGHLGDGLCGNRTLSRSGYHRPKSTAIGRVPNQRRPGG